VGAAFSKDLIKKYISLDTDIIAHGNQPLTILFQGEDMKVTDEDMPRIIRNTRGLGIPQAPDYFFWA
jgi:hypothetical protein